MDRRTNVRMDGCKEIHPCGLQDIGPLGPLPKKRIHSENIDNFIKAILKMTSPYTARLGRLLMVFYQDLSPHLPRPRPPNQHTGEETRPDTRLPQSRAGGQGPYLRSVEHLSRSDSAKNLINPKQGRIHGQYQSRTGGQGRKCAFSHFPTRSP